MRVVGIDPGGKRLGLAVGDTRSGMATPLAVIPYGGCVEAASNIAAAMSDTESETAVVGLPTNIDGERRPRHVADPTRWPAPWRNSVSMCVSSPNI